MARKDGKDRGLFERPRGIWWIRYHDENGDEHREKVGAKAAAKNLYSSRRNAIRLGEKLPDLVAKRKITFAMIAEAALVWVYAHRSRRYADAVKCHVKALTGAFGNVDAKKLTPAQVEHWLSKKRCSPATLNRYRTTVSLIYRQGIRDKKVESNPARTIGHRRERNTVVRWLQPDEEAKLKEVMLADCPEHWPEVVLAINTGLRRGEQWNLRWSQVDLSARRITLTETKNNDMRHIPLNDAALAALELAKVVADDSGYVFKAAKTSRDYSQGGLWFNRAIAKAKIAGFTWHCLRHTFASRLVMAGVDIRTVQQLLGHRSIQLTVRYSHLAPAHEMAAVQRLVTLPEIVHTAEAEQGGGDEKGWLN